MAQWHDDLSEFSIEEILRSQEENRAWGKELRRKAKVLVNDRLAKHVSLDEYIVDRKLAQEEATEYRRRAAILDTLISRRTIHLRPRES